jgi:hypothetical protein
MSLACTAAEKPPAGGSSASESGSESDGGTESESESESETETGEDDPCGACQPASDACSADAGASISSFSFDTENLQEDVDGSFSFEMDLCVIDSIESSGAVTLTASCGQGLTVIAYSATPSAPAPNVAPGAEVYITADVNGGGSGDGISWRRWTIEIAETREVVASFNEHGGAFADSATHGVCEGACNGGHMWERIGFPVSSGGESVVLFGGQHHVFSDSKEVWLEAQQNTDCESGEQSQYNTTLRIVPAP